VDGGGLALGDLGELLGGHHAQRLAVVHTAVHHPRRVAAAAAAAAPAIVITAGDERRSEHQADERLKSLHSFSSSYRTSIDDEVAARPRPTFKTRTLAKRRSEHPYAERGRPVPGPSTN